MIKKLSCIILVISVLIGVPPVFAESENLYTYQIYSPSDGITVNSASISVSTDNTAGNEKLYGNFFSFANKNIIGEKNYDIAYEIDVTELIVNGDSFPGLFISSRKKESEQEEYQLGENDEKIIISKTGIIQGSYQVKTAAGAENMTNMLRSFIEVPSASLLNCTIKITVTPYEASVTPDTTISLKASVGNQVLNLYNTSSSSYLFLPAHTGNVIDLTGNITLTDASGKDIPLSDTAVSISLTELAGEELRAGKKYYIPAKDSTGNAYADIVIMKADNLSTLFVTSDKAIDELHTSKEVDGSGSAVMIRADGTAVNNETALKRIKGRGNSTWLQSGEKRPYNIKLEEKQELINGAGKAKDWCLISDNCRGDWINSAPQLSTAAAYDMYEAIGGAYPVAHEFINLYINGDYRGVYMITEKIEIGSKRVNITETEYSVEDEEYVETVIQKQGVVNKPEHWEEWIEEYASFVEPTEDIALAAGVQAYQYRPYSVVDGKSGGILLEMDRGFEGEPCWFITRNGYPYVLKEPDIATKEQVQNIAKYVQEYEDAVYSDTGYNSLGRHYTDYLDLDSMVKKIMVDMSSAQTDAFVSSCYMTADVDENGDFTKLVAGPAWDYDGSDYGETNVVQDFNKATNRLIIEFFEHGDFSARYAELTHGEYRDIWNNEKTVLESYTNSLMNSYELNTVLWNINGSNPMSTEFDAMKADFDGRYDAYYNNFFAEDKLLGITASVRDNKVLTAEVSGTASAYQWYKVTKDGEMEVIEGATEATYIPEQAGVYGCAASGLTASGLDIETMYSNPVYVKIQSGISLSVNFDLDSSEGPARAYIAKYTSDGRLNDIKSQILTASGQIPINIEPNFTYKAFLWNGEMQPLCTPFTIGNTVN